ncbi:ANTAR domain-containing response regulator [Paenibacillus sp. YYML68]|uniref:ANTAR domain-containing response regulator n=1 Tax=Paenibacillus sp. YYML68 TaxID=2909250 RepID=UPI00248FAE0A|nr:ANTAR domain-containing protein [Paenibacillus sp. YYML68]
MLKSFALIHMPSPTAGTSGRLPASEAAPEARLQDLGMTVHSITSQKELSSTAVYYDAALLAVSPDHVASWCGRIESVRSVPIFWWCNGYTFPNHECTLDPAIDGLLGGAMSDLELHCAMLLGMNHYFQRTEWRQEREQLLAKLEERKWIDQAKRIISEIKKISEAEAYDFLRKQAMNERKRLVDVATSIVKVYQLLQDENKGGRRR